MYRRNEPTVSGKLLIGLLRKTRSVRRASRKEADSQIPIREQIPTHVQWLLCVVAAFLQFRCIFPFSRGGLAVSLVIDLCPDSSADNPKHAILLANSLKREKYQAYYCFSSTKCMESTTVMEQKDL